MSESQWRARAFLSSSDGQFDNPLGIAIDEMGNVFVADENNLREQIFSPGS